MKEHRTWSKVAKKIHPYTPGEQPKIMNLIKLNTNENPYPPAPGVIKAYEEFDLDTLRLYPDPESGNLRKTIAEYTGFPTGQVFVGNGSDEVLALAFLAYFDSDLVLKTPDIGYSFYPVYADLFNIPLEKIPLDENFFVHIEDYYNSPGGVIIANPNAPTGIALSYAQIEAICQNNQRAVIIDEAYIAFGAESAEALINSYDNLLIVRTLSKSHSLAGLRVGYALGSPAMIEALSRVKNSFNSYPLDRLAQVLAEAAIADREYFQKCSEAIIKTREKFIKALQELAFECLPSKANFVFARPGNMTAKHVQDALRERGILVRHFDAPRIADYLRISIGTDEQMDKTIAALKEILL